jgi:cyclic lactone autoinducer peptide
MSTHGISNQTKLLDEKLAKLTAKGFKLVGAMVVPRCCGIFFELVDRAMARNIL